MNRISSVAAAGLILLLAASALIAPVLVTPAEAADTFSNFPGRWTGEGRIGFKDGKTENVSCRATYFVAAETNTLTQNIRCASPSGKIEVKSNVSEKDGALTGTWNELIYNMTGELTGQVTKRGFLVNVKGTGESDLSATMDIMVKDQKQVVEIHFNSSTLLGLTLLLGKSTTQQTTDAAE